MATKPTVSTEWATQSVANGVNSTNNKVESTQSHKDYGFTFPEPPGRNHFNYWMNAVDQWKEYFEAQEVGADTLNVNFNINAETSDYSTRTIVIGAGIVVKETSATEVDFEQSTETTLIIPASSVRYICVSTLTGNVTASYEQLYSNKVALYKVTTDATSITQVIDLRGSVKTLNSIGGSVYMDAQDKGAITGKYSTPGVTADNDPNWFLGAYGLTTGPTATQGFSVTNSSTDYIEYTPTVGWVTGSNVDVTFNGDARVTASLASLTHADNIMPKEYIDQEVTAANAYTDAAEASANSYTDTREAAANAYTDTEVASLIGGGDTIGSYVFAIVSFLDIPNDGIAFKDTVSGADLVLTSSGMEVGGNLIFDWGKSGSLTGTWIHQGYIQDNDLSALSLWQRIA